MPKARGELPEVTMTPIRAMARAFNEWVGLGQSCDLAIEFR